MTKEYVQKAQELDQGLAEAHAAMAAVLSFYEHLWEPAEVEYKRAIELQPSYSSAHQWYHNTLLFLRRKYRLLQIQRAYNPRLREDLITNLLGV